MYFIALRCLLVCVFLFDVTITIISFYVSAYMKYVEGDHTAYSLHLSPEQDFLPASGGSLNGNIPQSAVHK